MVVQMTALLRTSVKISLLLVAASPFSDAFTIVSTPVKSARTRTSWLSATDEPVVSSDGEVQYPPFKVDRLPSPIKESLRNNYYFLRHGQSTANVAGVISSARSLANSTRHGLTEFGVKQGEDSAVSLLDQLDGVEPGDLVTFVSSPFARAIQTAQACWRGLQAEENKERFQSMQLKLTDIDETDIRKDDRLMERYFGRLDDEAIYTYAYVWPLDAFDTTHTAFDVESVASVCTRFKSLILDLEKDFEDEPRHVVLVSHADVLQISQLYAANAVNVGSFSSYRFANGEVRSMKRSPDSLPEPSPLEAPRRGTNM